MFYDKMNFAVFFAKSENFMLLEFTVTNFKSFKDQVVFSMRPAPKQKGLDYSILQKKSEK